MNQILIRPRICEFTAEIFLGLLAGAVAGGSTTLFLYALQTVTTWREAQPHLVWFLPLAGLGIGMIYFYFGSRAQQGHSLIIKEYHEPKERLPFQMAPLLFLSTLATHLFGGSAGREGTAVQLSANLSDHCSTLFKLNPSHRKKLLLAGVGAGFGAAVGTPWAGAIFGMEFMRIGPLKLKAYKECIIASVLGYYLTVLLKAPHSAFVKIDIPRFQLNIVLSVIISGIIFGVAAKYFLVLTKLIENLHKKYISYIPLRPFIGGLFLLFFFLIDGTGRFQGLGISEIQKSLQQPSSLEIPFLKSFSTALTVGSGFKGGEFIPLVFIGTTLGSALSFLLPTSFSLLAALGFSGVFAGASKTPLACTIMAMEIFGVKIAMYALITCLLSTYFAGQRGIYSLEPQDV